MQFKTKLLHTHHTAENSTGALTTPIYQSSTLPMAVPKMVERVLPVNSRGLSTVV